jgi:hypothetical protein
MKMGEWAYPKDKLSVVIFMTDSYIKALRDKGRKGSKSLMVIRTYAPCAEMKKPALGGHKRTYLTIARFSRRF